MISFGTNARIEHEGDFRLGLSSHTFPPTKSPCALQMFKNSTLKIHGSVATAHGVLITVNENAT